MLEKFHCSALISPHHSWIKERRLIHVLMAMPLLHFLPSSNGWQVMTHFRSIYSLARHHPFCLMLFSLLQQQSIRSAHVHVICARLCKCTTALGQKMHREDNQISHNIAGYKQGRLQPKSWGAIPFSRTPAHAANCTTVSLCWDYVLAPTTSVQECST